MWIVLIICGLCAGVVLAAHAVLYAPILSPSGHLPVHVPLGAAAGDVLHITIGPVTVMNGTPVGLMLVGMQGPRLYQAEFQAGHALFTIPAEHTLQPGYLALIAASGAARGEASIVLKSSERGTTYHVPDGALLSSQRSSAA